MDGQDVGQRSASAQITSWYQGHNLTERQTMRAINRLTVQSVNRAKEPGLYADGGGLYLRVAPGGSKSWILRYRHGGKRHDMGLGSVRLLPLAEARQRALEQHRALRLQGINPLTTR